MVLLLTQRLHFILLHAYSQAEIRQGLLASAFVHFPTRSYCGVVLPHGLNVVWENSHSWKTNQAFEKSRHMLYTIRPSQQGFELQWPLWWAYYAQMDIGHTEFRNPMKARFSSPRETHDYSIGRDYRSVPLRVFYRTFHSTLTPHTVDFSPLCDC